jgi:hypothetical protein
VGGFLIFEGVVVFGMVVFGALIVVSGFFMRVFISGLTSAGSGDANADSLLRPGHWEGFFGRVFGRNSKGTLFNVFQNRRSPKWLVWGSVSKITWEKGVYITIKIPFCDWNSSHKNAVS